MASERKVFEKTAKLSDGERTTELRILGFVNSPVESKIPTRKMNYARVCDFEMTVKPGTTIREIKDFTLARLPTLNYYQMEFEFWNKTLKDAVTIKDLDDEYSFFRMVNCLHLHIICPDDMFKAMYKTFRDLGINEEKALEQTKSFMDTVQNKDTDYEYDFAMRMEACRQKLEKYGIKIRSKNPPPTVCE